MSEIDGAIGGGSVLRIGVGLAVALGQAIKIFNIRQGRPKPGLQAQHLAGLLAVAELCDAKLNGAELGSREVEFHPAEIKKQKIKIEIATAGAIGLALQPLQIACLKARQPVEIEIEGGGTFGAWAPPAPYIQHVNFSLLEKLGFKAELKIDRHGFYPKGGARATAKFWPPEHRGPIVLEERGKLLKIEGVSVASAHLMKAKVAERQAQSAYRVLAQAFSDLPLEIAQQYVESRSPGSAVVLWAACEKTIIGADTLGERGVPAEQVGQQAAISLVDELKSDATVDKHMADQMIPFLALYGGSLVCSELTDHIKTNIYVAEKLTGKKFAVEGRRISFVEAAALPLKSHSARGSSSPPP